MRYYQTHKKTFFKYCLDCEKRFQPTGRGVRFCDKCRSIRMKKCYEKRKKKSKIFKYLIVK